MAVMLHHLESTFLVKEMLDYLKCVLACLCYLGARRARSGVAQNQADVSTTRAEWLLANLATRMGQDPWVESRVLHFTTVAKVFARQLSPLVATLGTCPLQIGRS